MRRFLPLCLAAGLLVAADEQQAAPDPAKLEEELLALEKESWEMVKRRDAAGLRRYATDNFLWIFADGTRVQKKQLDRFLAGYDLVSFTFADHEVIRFDDGAAVLVYKLTYTGGEKGKKPVKQTVWASSTYVRRGNAWKEILYQETAIKE